MPPNGGTSKKNQRSDCANVTTGTGNFGLTDKLAHERMDVLGVPHSGTQQKFMPLRMQCRFITLENVDFHSHGGFAR